ncbi:UDP-N-acetylglucosamine 1-carboxyvinyltransferase [Nanchangia anserum]|uniref:UDP-N-acetylglucosamine 1-carboxyvinyltransferase n=1 Tax=Nanchangia anserum TaxID=2692125 RepID=A0A8I0KQY3_9ACTO|nr:UDP-N-acetylglucosamine 1-carboxyvinyltransferase [Nanchangia anserum]MBD3688897.1 UDP-N-acetylglucosamine 1-carboxyvinyltransferase [Nanchangia anserum]QOX81161.1 UDP-N-acetylglucosamine 1-carboxyvinyltransferase [Nanchangia anserum]
MRDAVQETVRKGAILQVDGGRPLTGEVEVRGAKNFVPKAMVAALLADTPSELRNVPQIADVDIVSDMLRLHGASVDYDVEQGILRIDPAHVSSPTVEAMGKQAGQSRIPILFCGPLLHRLGTAMIPDLGGCEIGGRPIDYHLSMLRSFGAEVEKVTDGIRISAPRGLKGTRFTLEYPSVGATEQMLLSAVRAEGKTELRGAAIEPEIMDLINVLQKMGAIISVDTDRTIRIEGVEQLRGYVHRSLPDRIEAASWASAALATGGDIYVKGAIQPDMTTFLNVFRKVGGEFEVHHDGIRFYHPGGDLHSLALETNVHPGFMTDWQQPLVVALTQATGISIVHETVYEKRFGFTTALNKMGAQIQVYAECLGGLECRFWQDNHKHSAVILGPTPLSGAEITIPDLRGGFSHLIAALSASGTSTVCGVHIILRGYENFIGKLRGLGAQIRIIDNPAGA